MTSLLNLLDRFENAAGVYERSDDPADRDELHAARRAIMEAFEAAATAPTVGDTDCSMVTAIVETPARGRTADWRLVLKEPDVGMHDAAVEIYNSYGFVPDRIFAAMIDASPAPTAGEIEEALLAPPASAREAELVKALETARKVVKQIVFVATEEGGLSAANGDEAWFSEHGKTAMDAIEAALKPSLEQE
jgi:hypothetical protein